MQVLNTVRETLDVVLHFQGDEKPRIDRPRLRNRLDMFTRCSARPQYSTMFDDSALEMVWLMARCLLHGVACQLRR